MTNLLIRLFVPDHENVTSPKVRRRYGTVVSVVGVLVNVLLAGIKFLAGLLSGSVAILADGVNNLSDAGSSVISFVTFRISAKPADRDHPFGHARIEYVTSMTVAFLILLIGFEFLKESVTGIFHPQPVEFSILTVVILSVSILGKLWLMLLNRKVGKRINSGIMRAAAADSLSDVLSTSCVLVTVIVSFVVRSFGAELPFPLDSYMGVLVALFILWSGIGILRETKDSILGEAPDPETVEAITKLVMAFPEALGIHDLTVHSYGAGHTMASLHVEVDGAVNVFVSHEAVDAMEQKLFRELGVVASIHLDPIVVGDPIVDEYKARLTELMAGLYPAVRLHDFRMVKGEKRTNLIFDLEVPFEIKTANSEIVCRVQAAVAEAFPGHFAVVQIDRV